MRGINFLHGIEKNKINLVRAEYFFHGNRANGGSVIRGVNFWHNKLAKQNSVLSSIFSVIKISVITVIAVVVGIPAVAQEVNKSLVKGNELYRKGEFEKAIEQYRIVLEKNPGNKPASYNMANALYRSGKFSEAEKLYDEGLEGNEDRQSLHKAYYNKGVALTKQQKLEESVEAYKQAILLDPTDVDTRFNLQKALVELRKRQQADKKEEQDKDQKKQQQPQKPQSKLSKRQVENLLKSLQQREQEAQKKMQQSRRRGVTQPEKDW